MKPNCDCCGHPSSELTPLCVVEPVVDCRRVEVCRPCLDRIDPDMWIDRAVWTRQGPAVPYENLPVEPHDGRSL